MNHQDAGWVVRALVYMTDNSFYYFRVCNNTKKRIVPSEWEADGRAFIRSYHTQGAGTGSHPRLKATCGWL